MTIIISLILKQKCWICLVDITCHNLSMIKRISEFD